MPLPACWHAAARTTLLLAMTGVPSERGTAQDVQFTDVSHAAGVDYLYGLDTSSGDDRFGIVGGAAAADFDRDGWVDLYLVSGSGAPNRLLRNRGNGTFEDVAVGAGVADAGFNDSGPLFADFDGDGWPDLFVGGHGGDSPHVFRNRGDGTFEDVTGNAPWPDGMDYIGASAGDYDRDGDLDLATAHWKTPNRIFVWRNEGGFLFTDATADAGLALIRQDAFTPIFSDVNLDGWPDLLSVGDFGTTEYFHNDGAGRFQLMTSPDVSDEHGMGSAVGDYDNDGDLDWFVSSISAEEGAGIAFTGNRLYRNTGDGTFEDATDEAGVRRGYWGWGACFADFDNDGWLDIFHVNGFDVFTEPVWLTDPSRLFMNDGDGRFSERSTEMGLNDNRSGRGVVCFDYDRDGDVDIFMANRNGGHRLFRNDGGNTAGNFLRIRLAAGEDAPHAAGTRVHLSTPAGNQMRELRYGSNFVSQNPRELYFGLGSVSAVDLVVLWPDGTTQNASGVAANQEILIVQGEAIHGEVVHEEAHEVPAFGGRTAWLAAVLLLLSGMAATGRKPGLSRVPGHCPHSINATRDHQ